MYYGLILLSVVMFGACFALNDVYRAKRGSSLTVSLEFTCISSIAGLAVLFTANRLNRIPIPEEISSGIFVKTGGKRRLFLL